MNEKFKRRIKDFFSVSKLSVLIYWLIIIALLGLFFTNDFGLVDIHKTAIITAVGIDAEEGEVIVTCEVAVPQPSQSGDNIKYTQIQGSGLTIADALNEVNSKTGFYPKLQFCKLILVGEDCQNQELFRMLGCFYRKNYSELTALVAMCKGKASDMLAMSSPVSDMTSEAITKSLSEEIEKSANAASVSLKDIAMREFSKSGACYMPFVAEIKLAVKEILAEAEKEAELEAAEAQKKAEAAADRAAVRAVRARRAAKAENVRRARAGRAIRAAGKWSLPPVKRLYSRAESSRGCYPRNRPSRCL